MKLNEQTMGLFVAGLAAESRDTSILNHRKRYDLPEQVSAYDIDGRLTIAGGLQAISPSQQLKLIERLVAAHHPERVVAVAHCFGSIAVRVALSRGLVDRAVLVSPSVVKQIDALGRVTIKGMEHISGGARLTTQDGKSVYYPLKSGRYVCVGEGFYDDPLLYGNPVEIVDEITGYLDADRVAILLPTEDFNPIPMATFGKSGLIGDHANIHELPGSHAFGRHEGELTRAIARIQECAQF